MGKKNMFVPSDCISTSANFFLRNFPSFRFSLNKNHALDNYLHSVLLLRDNGIIAREITRHTNNSRTGLRDVSWRNDRHLFHSVVPVIRTVHLIARQLKGSARNLIT